MRKEAMPAKPSSSAGVVELNRRAKAELRALGVEDEHRPMMAELRRRAEARLREGRRNEGSEVSGQKAAAESQRTVHELQVHQIELEVQNEELQQARDRMEVMLEKYTDLYDFAPIGYFSLDEKGLILEANLAGATLLGVERSRLIHQRLQRFVPPPSRPEFLAFLEKVFAKRGKQVCAASFLKERGGAFLGDLQAIAAISTSGTRKWCRVSISDITAFRQAEEALRESEARFRVMLDAIAQLAWQAQPDGFITWYNRRWYEYTGTTPEQMEGWGWQSVHDPEMLPKVLKRWRASIATGKPFDMAFPLRGADGGFRLFLTRVVPQKDKQGRVLQWFGTNTDVEDQQRAAETQRRLEVLAASNQKLKREIVRRQASEEALKKSEQHQSQMLEQSRHMQERLRHLSRQILLAQEEERKKISRELHDVIAQTLMGINVQLTRLKKEAAVNTKGLKKNISRTQRLVEKSVDVVHQFARELRPAVLDDLGLIPALHTYMKGFTEQTGIHVSLTASAAVEHLKGDQRTVLYRVAQEALTNAARHAQASRAEVKIQKLDGRVRLEIKDNGKGFQPGRMLQAGKNTRLGLLGMIERVEMVGGELAIASTPGKGTTIQAQIPFSSASERGATSTKPL